MLSRCLLTTTIISFGNNRTLVGQAYINRGDVLLRLNRPEEALSVYERALAIDPANADLYYNLGVVHLDRGRQRQALSHLDRALELDPDHAQALTNSAALMQEAGRPEDRPEARRRLLRAARLQPDSERVHFNLGMLAMDDGDGQGAEAWFRRAVELRPGGFCFTSPTTDGGMQKWMLSRKMYTLHARFLHVWCPFVCSVGA